MTLTAHTHDVVEPSYSTVVADDGPITRESLRQRTYSRLKAAILTGLLQPGEIYPIKLFAERYGVSRTPVRDAVMDLASQGFLEVVPNRGFRVRPVTEKDQDDIAEAREMLEVPAMVRLARTISEDAVDTARQLCARAVRLAQENDLPNYLEADRAFHLYLIAQCQNGQLVRMVSELRDRMHLHGMPILAENGRLVATAEEHVELVDALATHDTVRTEEIMIRHLKHLRSDWAGRTGGEDSGDQSTTAR